MLKPPERTIRVRRTSQKMACPNCGQLGRRMQMEASQANGNLETSVAVLSASLMAGIHDGHYVAKCKCCMAFHSLPPGVDLKAKYDHKVRQTIIDQILQGNLNLSAVRAILQCDFLLWLSTGYVNAALDYAPRQRGGNEFHEQVHDRCSGVMRVEEIHLSKRVLMLASDPIADNPLAQRTKKKNQQPRFNRKARCLGKVGC